MSPNLSQHSRLEASDAQKACWTSSMSSISEALIQLTKQLLEGDISRMGPSLERKEKREEVECVLVI